MKSDEIRIGLALGAGAAKGIAHIGVLSVLEEAGVPIHMVAGCSMGSVIGAMYACGKTPAEMEAMIGDFERDGGRSLVDPATDGMGLIQGRRVEKYLESKIGKAEFKDTKVPFAAAACCIEDGGMTYFREGRLATAVHASAAMPGVFCPVSLNGKTYVDGGVLDRVPCDILREMGADLIIAVDVGYRGGGRLKPRNLLDVMGDYFSMVGWQAMANTMIQADCILTPSVLDFASSDFGKGREIFRRGRVEALARIDEVVSTLAMAGVKLRPGHGGICPES